MASLREASLDQLLSAIREARLAGASEDDIDAALRESRLPEPPPVLRLLFVAHEDGRYLCEPCAKFAGIDLGDDGVSVWEEGSTGWTGEVGPCAGCGKPIDVVVGEGPDA